MSVSTLESENAQPVAQTQNSELIYRLEDRPPLPQTLFAACQHLLAMFVAVITPALLICQALGLPAQDTQHIISMSLFASGVASIIQIKAWGPVGSGLLSIQGTSFNFVAPLIMGGTALKTGGADVPTMMAALFGTLMLASCTEMVISPRSASGAPHYYAAGFWRCGDDYRPVANSGWADLHWRRLRSHER